MEVLVPSQSILEKLQLKEEKNLLIQGLPSTIEKQFVKLSFAKNITPLLKIRKIDFALVFAISKTQLTDILRDVLPALNKDAKFWIAYPKQTSKIVSDLSRDSSWDCVAQLGYEAVRMISLDPVWCAMCFKNEAQIKRSKQLDAQIAHENALAQELTLPIELEHLLEENTEAKDFFEGLTYGNKKEYLVWITGAKKDETRLARLEATIEKLSNGKHHPAEK